MAFLDSNIPLKQVLVGVTAITAFVFSLGQISSRFNAVESTLTNLMSEEESMATKEELNVVGERLSKKIQIQNDQQELIHELELKLQELRIRFEEHNH